MLALATPFPPPRPSPFLLILWVKEPALALFCLGGDVRWVKGAAGQDCGSGCRRPEGRKRSRSGREARRGILRRRAAKIPARPRRFVRLWRAEPLCLGAERAESPAPAGNFPQPAHFSCRRVRAAAWARAMGSGGGRRGNAAAGAGATCPARRC